MVLLARQGLKPFVLTVNHGMRQEAEAEATYVGTIARQFNLPHTILSAPTSAKKPITQADARDLRYGLLADWCNQKGIKFCALGHHKKDQAETFLFRLYRGSGIEGLASMQDDMVYQGCHFIRPLLDAEPEALKELLRMENIQWCDDPSNHAPKYMRTHLGKAIKSLPLSFDALTQAAAGAKTIKEERAKRVELFLSQKAHFFSGGYCALEAEALAHQKEIIARAILAQVIKWITGAVFSPRGGALENLRTEMGNRDKTAKTLAHCHIIYKEGSFYFFKEQAHLAMPRVGVKTWDNRFYFDGVMPKDAMLGAVGKLEQEVDSSIPKIIRPTLPALWHKGEIIAAPHLAIGDKALGQSIKFLREGGFSAKT
jgi:tRNA(Ile)-lysidine synthase